MTAETTMNPTERIETREVLASAYLSGRRSHTYLTHSVVADDRGNEIRVLCNRVNLMRVADHLSNPAGLNEPPTCKMCLRRDPRFAVPKGA
jgi:hypothetical protein